MGNGIRSWLDRCKGERNHVQKLVGSLTAEVSRIKAELTTAERARVVIQQVAKETQNALEYHVSDLVSHALAAVFDEPYTFRLFFSLRRDKTEADLVWEKNGRRYPPNGGGVRDVSSFGLRVALWSLRDKKSRPVLILDEPFKHLKPSSLQSRAGAMLKEISGAVGLQIIMVTHDSALATVADRSFEAELKGGVTHIKQAQTGPRKGGLHNG